MFLLNSRLGLFVETCQSFSSITSITMQALLLPKLRSYFAEFLNDNYLNAWAYSARLPVSVCGTITFWFARSFSCQCGINRTHLFLRIDMHTTLQGLWLHGFTYGIPLYGYLGVHTPSRPTLLSHSFTQTPKCGAGIFSLLSIAYSNWPRLRYRLTLSGWTVLTETLDLRRTGISPIFSLLIPTYSLL